ncbi:response regulator [Planctomycetota bacterium]
MTSYTSTVAPKKKTVLLVDDDAKLLQGLKRALSGEDYELYTAISPAEAKAFLNTCPVDLVLSDNLMPGVLGTEFLADVHSQYPTTKLMMLSGYLPPTAAQKAMDNIGISQILNKPCKASEVATAIRDVLASAETANENG